MKRINIKNYPFRLRLHLLPILVWLAAVACVIGLFTRRSQRFCKLPGPVERRPSNTV